MTTKLTLSIDEDIIKEAKRYAQKSGRSLSDIVENHFQLLCEGHQEPSNVSLKLKKIVGLIKLPADFDEKKELATYYEKKYL